MIRGFLLALVVVAAGFFVDWNPAVRAQFESLAAARPAMEEEAMRLGIPLSASELAPNPPVPSDENAVPLIRQAMEMVRAVDRERNAPGPEPSRVLKRAVEDPTPDHEAAADSALAALEPALALASVAAKRPRADFGRDWTGTNTLDMMFDGLEQPAQLAEILSDRAVLRARRNATSGALRDLRDAFALCAHVGADPVVAVLWRRQLIESYVVGRARLAAAERSDDARFLAELERLLAEVEAQPIDIRRYLRSEALLSVDIARQAVERSEELSQLVMEGDPLQFQREVGSRRLPPSLRTDAYVARSLQFWNAVVSGVEADDGYETLRRVWQAAAERYARADDPTAVVLRMSLAIGVDRLDVRRVRAASFATTRGLLRAMRFWAENGRFPASLAEAGLELTDPFDGQPLRYRVEDDGVRVWSIGRDGVDHGGRLHREIREAGGEGWDVVAAFVPRRADP